MIKVYNVFVFPSQRYAIPSPNQPTMPAQITFQCRFVQPDNKIKCNRCATDQFSGLAMQCSLPECTDSLKPQ